MDSFIIMKYSFLSFIMLLLLLLLFNPYPRVHLLIFRGRGGERNIGVGEKHRLVASIHVPVGDQTYNLLVYKMTFQPTEPPNQGYNAIIFKTTLPDIKIVDLFFLCFLCLAVISSSFHLLSTYVCI